MADARLTSYTASVKVRACGRVWRLDRAASLEELWDAMAEGNGDFDDERLPYWTELWPSSVALAEWLLLRQEEIASRRCLDLGCGLGLTAMIGQWLGARVLGMDYEEQALRFARHNAAHNNVSQPLWTVMDWRHPAVARRSVDVVWGGDIMYERRFVTPVLDFLEHVLTPQGKAWIAEPCRTVYDAFRAEVYRRKWRGQRVHTGIVDPIYAQPARVTVHVWELVRC